MVPAVFAEGMSVNGDRFGERESVSKTAGGHISCKCSQMLVKVYLPCTCDWKNSFQEGLLTPEARASFLLGLLCALLPPALYPVLDLKMFHRHQGQLYSIFCRSCSSVHTHPDMPFKFLSLCCKC